ncbi:uncharacterized protein LOC100646446 [Bombus terrestris]|uniref:Uncharacterized protein LOC100646446 n=1 Tax=Bombus terrestris TaxID=30195 RepID=A0A9B7HYD6_BOMTE|nr:uncharacterized protein LOC100646446 [Bombus terrestris]
MYSNTYYDDRSRIWKIFIQIWFFTPLLFYLLMPGKDLVKLSKTRIFFPVFAFFTDSRIPIWQRLHNDFPCITSISMTTSHLIAIRQKLVQSERAESWRAVDERLRWHAVLSHFNTNIGCRYQGQATTIASIEVIEVVVSDDTSKYTNYIG